MINAYIIRLSNSELSKTLADEAFKSARRFEVNPIYFEGIDRKDADSVLSKFGLKCDRLLNEEPSGSRGCLASHYSLWLKAIESGEPIVVMEHDGVVIREISDVSMMVDDVCHLDPKDTADPLYSKQVFNHHGVGVKEYFKSRRPDLGEIIGIKNVSNKPSTDKFKGGYGYVITPKGATKLVDYYKTNEIPSADTAISKNAVNLQITLSTHIRLNPYYKDARTILDFSTRKREDL